MSTPGEKIAVLESEMETIKAEIASIRSDVGSLKSFRAWLLGIGTVAGALFGMIADKIVGRS